jgi:raffinose/stachyose/melibiose transport system substrate-binding protein
MEKRKWSRRDFLRAGALTAVGAALAGCGPAPTPEVEVEEEVVTQAPELKEWVIVMQAGEGLIPTDPGAELAEGEIPVVGLGPAAEAYHELHPNVTIEWYPLPTGMQIDEWLHARMAAQDAPDIYHDEADSLWPHIHKGWALDMTEWVNTPNPYMPGKRPWVSYIDDVGRLAEIGPDGKTYGICLDGAGVMLIYNKDAFADAGITQEPETWTEFEEVWQKLLDKGYIPFGGDMPHVNCCFHHWMWGHIFNQLANDVILDYDDDKTGLVTAKEMVQHTQLGDWPLWDYELEVARFYQRIEPFLPPGYAGQVDFRQLWRQGKVVMYMEGSWAVMGFEKDPPPFEYGWLFFPKITKDTSPLSTEKTIRLQGPWGLTDFHVPGYLAETDPERIPVIMDWLMFITQPEYVTAITAENGNVPFVEGSTPPPEIEPFTRPYDDVVHCEGWAILAESAHNREIEIKTEYMAGGISDDELLAKLKEAWADEVRKSLESNPDWKI